MTDNTTLADELEACPFCGGRAIMRQDDDPGYPFYVTFDHADTCPMYAVPTDMFRSFTSKAEAIAAWNTRTPSPAPVGGDVVERVARAIADANQEDYDALPDLHKAMARAALAAIQRAPKMEIMLPPASIGGDYLQGWCEGQAWMIENYGTSEEWDNAISLTEKLDELLNAQPTPAQPDDVVERVAKGVVDRTIKRLKAMHDYAGRPAWDAVIAEELRAAIAAMPVQAMKPVDIIEAIQQMLERGRATLDKDGYLVSVPMPVQAPVADDVQELVGRLQVVVMGLDEIGCHANARVVHDAINVITHLTQPQADAEVAVELNKLREALVQHNERVRSALSIAQRDGETTNWKAFRGQCQYTLAEYHDLVNEARAAIRAGGQAS